MLILSNGFPTNMPNSEGISQGGPANFARLFYNDASFSTQSSWMGVMFKKSNFSSPRLKKIHAFPGRTFYQMYVPKNQLANLFKPKRGVDKDNIFKKTIDRMSDFMKKQKPDVVFLNGFGVFNWVLLKAARQAGIPVVIQHAGIWTKELDIHKKQLNPISRKIMEEMEKDSTKFTQAEIFLNTWSKKYYFENVAKRQDEHSYIIPLPFNFSAFKQQRNENSQSVFSKLDKKKFHIGVIARWDEIKNHSAILTLAKEITKQGLPWQIHAVTKIPENDPKKKEYEKLISVTAELDRAGISDFCRSMDLLIQPSVFDVSPTVVLEATASDTPIAISSCVGYVDNFIANGAKDWVIDWDRADEVIARISKIKGKKMPQALKEYLIYHHDHSRIIKAYIDLFSKIRLTHSIYLAS